MGPENNDPSAAGSRNLLEFGDTRGASKRATDQGGEKQNVLLTKGFFDCAVGISDTDAVTGLRVAPPAADGDGVAAAAAVGLLLLDIAKVC